ncbi:MAG: polysaccharide biosynthesis protein [Deltaproteobacteria bacterium]|nr:polysaccharide biosynthesis protein [Deltaproteobacteria bacterium]
MLLIDAALVAAAYTLAFLLRFDGHIPLDHYVKLKETMLFIVPFKLVCFFALGLYNGMWRYTSFIDLRNVFRASTFSSVVIVLSILYLYHFQGYSRSVYIIDWLFTFLLIGGVRITIRFALANRFPFFWTFKRHVNPSVKKALIIGAGDAGEKILKEMQENPEINFEPILFLDDNLSKQGQAIHGIPVLGTVDQIGKFQTKFDEILIAVPSARGEQMRRIVDLCEKTGKRFRTVPGIMEIIEGKVSVKAIRDVTLEDLLGREEVRLDEDEIKRYLNNRRILVTGAGGSIGSELVRQICRFRPQALAVLDFNECNLSRLEMECAQRFGSIEVSGFLMDIRDRLSVSQVFREFSPDVVFHAAAYKHVPIQELNPWEAVYNNVQGTRNLVEEASKSQVERFVLVSTDKAVRPSSAMGATKRVGEMLVESMNGSTKTRFMAVRFGNVIGSSGSAIPIFQEQISRGYPVTVTHPEITRYFMSVKEAAQLILQAGAMGEGSEIFILDMGKPMRIVDLAKDLICLSGREPEKDVPIQFTGLRPGEKLYEELITEGEGIVVTNHEKVLVLRGNSFDRDALNADIDALLSVADTRDATAIKKKLREIVPEYTPQYQE